MILWCFHSSENRYMVVRGVCRVQAFLSHVHSSLKATVDRILSQCLCDGELACCRSGSSGCINSDSLCKRDAMPLSVSRGHWWVSKGRINQPPISFEFCRLARSRGRGSNAQVRFGGHTIL
eukprot:TRINITY_DN26_c0_g1_i8.p1 TRINITY_DN26_c0_g1~~TRINITY_DN26_c0_g1_i8.p1  ORF type:complete len:121 (-),score=15.03 TRINITY_DN26_c0_g1_i8:14-376(-)